MLGTGTSIARALAPYSEHIKHKPITVSYIDMLNAKDGEGFLFSDDFEGEGDKEKEALVDIRGNMVKFKARLQSLPGIHQLQMDMPDDLVNELIKNLDMTPSWPRIHGSPANITILTNIFERLLDEDLNDRLCLKPKMLEIDKGGDYSFMTVMVFGSGSMASIRRMSQAILASRHLREKFRVVALTSDSEDETSNENAEKTVNNAMAKAKRNGKEGLIILSLGMGSRSFSLGEMQAVIEMYDSGNINTAKQKQSRALTPYLGKEAGFVVTLSFDPNRLSDFEMGILDEASRRQKEGTGKDTLDETIREVYRVVSLWNFSSMGSPNLLKVDALMKKSLNRASELRRLIGAVADPKAATEDPELTDALIAIALNTNSGLTSAQREELKKRLLPIVPTTTPSGGPDSANETDNELSEREEKNDIDAIRRAFAQLSKLPFILGRYFSKDEETTFLDAVKECRDDDILSEDFYSLLGISPELMLSLKDEIWNQSGEFLDIAYTFGDED